MTRICFFVGDIARSGGVERVSTVIAGELALRGYDVTLLTLVDRGPSFFPLSGAIRLASLHMEGRRANLNDIRIVWRLRSFLRLGAFDYLIDVDTILSLYSIPATLGMRTRVISWEHFHFAVNVGDIFQRTRRALGRRLAARFGAKVVVLSDMDRHQYLQGLRCRSDVQVIGNPYTIVDDRQADLRKNIVLAVGRLTYQKGFDLLLSAWALVARSAPTWKLRIVGSGEEEGRLKEQCRQLGLDEHVEFMPTSRDIAQYFLNASVFALSSRFEGFPLVLLEAKSFGLPVVSFDCACGPSEIVRDGLDGILVKSECVTDLSCAIFSLISEPHKRVAFGDQALQDKRHSLKTVIDKWLDVVPSLDAQFRD